MYDRPLQKISEKNEKCFGINKKNEAKKSYHQNFGENQQNNLIKKKSIKISKTIIVEENQTYDGKGQLHVWNGKGDCSQKEGMPPMFVLKKGI